VERGWESWDATWSRVRPKALVWLPLGLAVGVLVWAMESCPAQFFDRKRVLRLDPNSSAWQEFQKKVHFDGPQGLSLVIPKGAPAGTLNCVTSYRIAQQGQVDACLGGALGLEVRLGVGSDAAGNRIVRFTDPGTGVFADPAGTRIGGAYVMAKHGETVVGAVRLTGDWTRLAPAVPMVELGYDQTAEWEWVLVLITFAEALAVLGGVIWVVQVVCVWCQGVPGKNGGG